MGREREHHGALGGDAHAVGGSLGAGKGPAAAAVGLVADVVDDLGASWEGEGGIKVGRDVFHTRGWNKVNHLAGSLGLRRAGKKEGKRVEGRVKRGE